MNVFHIQEDDKVLLLGEGNFSFCYSLVKLMQQFDNFNIRNVFGTCLENEHNSLITNEIKSFLNDSGSNVLFAVDATNLSNHPVLRELLFNKIIFNFPHVGGKMKIHLNRKLLQDFLLESSLLLANKGEIIVTLCAGQGGTPADIVQRRWDDSWQVVEMAARSGLVLREIQQFPHQLFDSYKSVGYRGKVTSFNSVNAMCHYFQKATPLLYSFDEPDKFLQLHNYDGILMSYPHMNRLLNNPLKSPNSPQSYMIRILEDICQNLGIAYSFLPEGPLFSKHPTYTNQAKCIVSGENCFLRKKLLPATTFRDHRDHYLMKGLTFNKISESFNLPPAECHVAVFGPLFCEICSEFKKQLTDRFSENVRNLAVLMENNWFIEMDDSGKGIYLNLDKILENIFDTNWRQLWVSGIEIKKSGEHYSLVPLCLYPQKFVFDISFWDKNGTFDSNKLISLVWQIDSELIESVNLLSIYEPDPAKKIYCFRFTYKSYCPPLCEKAALDYHYSVGKFIENQLQIEVV